MKQDMRAPPPVAAHRPFPATLPETLRAYELVGELYDIAPSTFFEGRNLVLGNALIIRRLTLDRARADDARETFFREQRHTAALSHRHIFRPLDVFEAEGFLWSVHEFLSGGASTTYVEKHGPLDVATAARLGSQVADALAYMHARGFVHGRVRPHEIGIDERGDAIIFNFVKSADLAAGIWPLRPAVVGLSPFSAPEELRGDKPTERSDLFSLAATICYWMCGVMPEEGESVDDWIARAQELHGEAAADTHCEMIPGAVIDALKWALEPDAAKRRGSVDVLGSLLVEAHQRLASETPSGFSTGARLTGPGHAVEILGRQGAGAFGVVLEAKSTLHGDRLAVKALKPEHRDDSEARQRFVREARAMGAVDHENVVRIHAVGEERGTPYAIMDFIAGPNLNDFIRTQGPLEQAEATRLGAALALGLAAIHAQGIIHRDLKPHNILLADGVHPQIADFGVAHDIDATRITGTGHLVGTPLYMAPEQIGRTPLTDRSDLYALGTILYEMLTGAPPFAGLDLVNTIRAIREQAPEPLPASVAPALREVVAALLEKDPDARPASAAVVAQRLEKI